MTQVAGLHQEWRRTARLIGDERTPWKQVRTLFGRANDLGIQLLETPASGLSDLAIKVRWLSEEDLESEVLKEGLRCVLRDIQLLQRQ